MPASPKLYDDILMDHIRNARNYCALDNADQVATGTNPLCGDEITVYVRLHEAHMREIAFQCTCCGISMASASIMTETLSGRKVDEALAAARAFGEFLRAPADRAPATARDDRQAVRDTVRRFPARLRCALLPWLTLEAALLGRTEAGFAHR